MSDVDQNSRTSRTSVTRLLYVMDPMCSWCWAFSGPWRRLTGSLDPVIEVRYVMGGLAPDDEAPMAESMRRAISETWRTIERRTGAQFNHEYWQVNTPRRSTYPACRAVVAAGMLAEDGRPRMIEAIQRAYYLEARNPSLDSVLVDVAADAGFDRDAFAAMAADERVFEAFGADLELSRRFGVQGFPTVIAEGRAAGGPPRYGLLASGYCDADSLAARWRQFADSLAANE